MKILKFLLLFSCSHGKKSNRKDITGHQFVRIIEKGVTWEKEKNCRMLKYTSVDGNNIQSTHEGYQNALNSLRLVTHDLGGTLAMVRDFTEARLWAHIYFCSHHYK